MNSTLWLLEYLKVDGVYISILKQCKTDFDCQFSFVFTLKYRHLPEAFLGGLFTIPMTAFEGCDNTSAEKETARNNFLVSIMTPNK